MLRLTVCVDDINDKADNFTASVTIYDHCLFERLECVLEVDRAMDFRISIVSSGNRLAQNRRLEVSLCGIIDLVDTTLVVEIR
jgi:hypothetical protein